MRTLRSSPIRSDRDVSYIDEDILHGSSQRSCSAIDEMLVDESSLAAFVLARNNSALINIMPNIYIMLDNLPSSKYFSRKPSKEDDTKYARPVRPNGAIKYTLESLLESGVRIVVR